MQTAIKLDAAMAEWTAAVHSVHGGNANEIRTACSSVIVRARKLSTETQLDFPEVAKFLLDKTRGWAVGGAPLNLVIQRLPTNLRELGIMKMTEDFEDVARLLGGKPN